MSPLRNRSSQILPVAMFGLTLFCGAVMAEKQLAGADKIVDNLDLTKTYTNPWVQGAAGKLRISRGAIGACQLLGMNNYLRGHVIWSSGLGKAAKISDKGIVGGEETGHYIESITCVSDSPYTLKITAESIDTNPDGSVTAKKPMVHTGAFHYKVYSGHAGACSLLGYNSAVNNSMKWSEQNEVGVTLGVDGTFYSKDTGSYLVELACINDPDKKPVSPNAWLHR